MKLIERMLSKFGYVKKGVSTPVEDSRFWRSLRSLSADSMEVANPYEKSVWVFASINAIAQNISRVPFLIYKEKYRKSKEIVEEGEFYELFINPNPQMTTSSLFFATVIYLELFGESFWVLDGRSNITEIPERIWVVNPSFMEPVLNRDDKGIQRFNGYWEYNIGPERLILQPHEVIQFKYFNPYNPIRGLSGLEASRLGVDQDYLASKYNKEFFKSGISLSGIIKTPEFLTDEQYSRLKAQFEEKYQGYSNAHKVGIIEGGADFIETRAMSQRDMEFTVLKRVIRGEILAAFKTNEVVLGNYENIQSYEGIKNAHEAFWKETLLPKMVYIEDMLWSKFFSKIEGGKYWGGFDVSVVEALREDFGRKVELARTLFEMGYPINMINKRLDLGMDDVPWGNTWYVKLGVVPVESVLNLPAGEEPEKPDKEDGEKEEKSTQDFHIDSRDNPIYYTFLAKQVPVENMFKTKLKRFLFEQRKRVLTNVFQNKSDFFVMEEEKELLQKVLLELYSFAQHVGVILLEEELSLNIKESSEVDAFINSRLEKSTKLISDTIYRLLTNLVEKEQTVEGRAKLIRGFYNKIDNRVKTIARTESSAIINGVRFYLMKENGVQYHQWIPKVEGRHGYLNGRIVRIGDSFSKDFTLRYPLDMKAPAKEVVNCLCYCIPVIKYKKD